ncbi:taxadiene 5-alpha hydroxylase-like [Magnolia sinica]|uniref:taxadiene 5-alpha hydroxylase-like n=1 Tax=Magnolia sinica TaxID=86752 RepID=UPI002659CB55|nr:taxadiene 5-alpha hydroxylase-like [Magnolia sinica]
MFGPFEFESSLLILAAVTLISFSSFIVFVLRKDSRGTKLPPGYLGLPIIGESWSFFQAQRKNTGSEWINERVAQYGRVFKTSLLGSPTVVVTGREGNKFLFTAGHGVLSAKQPLPIRKVVGEKQLFEAPENRYKLVKSAMMSFLRPENLQEYIGIMDDLVKTRLLSVTKGKDMIKAVPLLKDLTFNVSCSLLFGIHDECTKAALFEDFSEAFKAVWSIPINFPGTLFRRGIKARSRIDRRMLPIVRMRKEMLMNGFLHAKSDVISSMIALKDENGEPITEQEIMDNVVLLVIASHDTTANLLSLMMWKLARDPMIYQKVLQEHMEILKERETQGGKLTWSEVQKMKYTWRVAQELMRLIPPVLGSFREALQDTSFGGYDIPKGWKPSVEDRKAFGSWRVLQPSRGKQDVFVSPSCSNGSFGHFNVIWKRIGWDSGGTKLPPGSLGLPIIGESWSFHQSQKDNKGSEWINERMVCYGRVFKTALMGSPTVVVTGREGNKFLFTASHEVLAAKQPMSIVKIVGKKQLNELPENRYKLIKGAMMSFLKPDNLQEYIGIMDDLAPSSGGELKRVPGSTDGSCRS